MPPVSQAQRRAMYAAKEGKSNLGIPQKVGAEFVEAGHGVTGLPGRIGDKRHDRPLKLGFKHAGTTVEGPELGRSLTVSKTFTKGNREDASDFDHAGTTREGPNWQAAAASGATASGRPVVRQEPKAFANSGTSKEGYFTTNCAMDAKGGTWDADGVSRPRRIRRKTGRDHSGRRSGDSPEGFRVHTRQAQRENPDDMSHYGTNRDEAQNRTPLAYAAGRQNQDSPVFKFGVKPSPAPASPGRAPKASMRLPAEERPGDRWLNPGSGPSAPHRGSPARRQDSHAFKMAIPERRGDKWLAGARASMERKGTVGSFTRSATRAGQSVQEHARSVLAKGSNASTTEKRRAVFAQNVRGFRH